MQTSCSPEKMGGLYKTNVRRSLDFVETFPSRALRDGKVSFPLKLSRK